MTTILAIGGNHSTWEAAGRDIANRINSSAWDLGDWYNAGNHYGWGEEAEAITGIALNTIRDAARIAARFPQGSAGRPAFSWTKAAALVTLTDAQIEPFLNRDLTRVDLRAEVKKIQQVAGLTEAQLAKVETIVKLTTAKAHAFRNANPSTTLDIAALQAETRRNVIADLNAGTDVRLDTYLEGFSTVLQAREFIVLLHNVRFILKNFHAPDSMKSDVADAISETITALTDALEAVK